MPGVAAHDCELAEPVIDEEGADDADHHEDKDDGPLVEYVFEAATGYLVHAQEEPAVRRQPCKGVWEKAGERYLMVFCPFRAAITPWGKKHLE